MSQFKKVTAFETPDGALHKSPAYARQHVASAEAVSAVAQILQDNPVLDAQHLINQINTREMGVIFRELFDATEALEKSVI